MKITLKKEKMDLKKALLSNKELDIILKGVHDEFAETAVQNTSNQVTWYNERIDRNSDWWFNFKKDRGYSTDSLEMKDYDFEKVTNHKKKKKKKGLYDYSLSSNLQSKYNTVSKITHKNYKDYLPQPSKLKEDAVFNDIMQKEILKELLKKGAFDVKFYI